MTLLQQVLDPGRRVGVDHQGGRTSVVGEDDVLTVGEDREELCLIDYRGLLSDGIVLRRGGGSG